MSRLVYVESSALASSLVERAPTMKVLQPSDQLVASILTVLEVERALRRAALDRRIDHEERSRGLRELRDFQGQTWLLPLDESVLTGARGLFPKEPVRTLDALHLATVVVLEERSGRSPVVLSLDGRVRENAVALGYEIQPT